MNKICTLKTEEFIGNKLEAIIEPHKKYTLLAGTGLGKSTAAINFKSKHFEYVIMVVPTIAIGKSKEDVETGIHFYYDGNDPIGNRWISTYDNILKVSPAILKEAIVFFDEQHLLASSTYRKSIPAIFDYIKHNAKTFVAMTGTGDQDVYGEVFDNVIEFKREKPRQINVINVIVPPALTANGAAEVKEIAVAQHLINDSLDCGRKVMLLMQNKVALKELQDSLNVGSIKIVSDESALTVTNSNEAKEVLATGYVDDNIQVILGTSVLVEGWDLKTNDTWDCIIVGSHLKQDIKTAQTVLQFAARSRNNKPVDIFVHRPLQSSGNYVQQSDYPRNKLVAARRLSAKRYKKQHHFDRKHMSSYGGFTDVPAFEQKQQHLNYINDWTLKSSKKFEKHLQRLGGNNVTCVNITQEVDSFKVSIDARSVLEALYSEEDYDSYDINKHTIQDFVKGLLEDDDMPSSFAKLRQWCFNYKTDAAKKLESTDSFIRLFKKDYLIKCLKEEKGEVNPSNHILKLNRVKANFWVGVNRYNVGEWLRSKMEQDLLYSKAQMLSLFKKCPAKYFYSANDKSSFVNRRKKVQVLELFEPFLQLESQVKVVNKKRVAEYKLSDTSPFLEEVKLLAIMDVIEAEANALEDDHNNKRELEVLTKRFNLFRDKLDIKNENCMRELEIFDDDY